MSPTATTPTQALRGVYEADAVHSVFGFAVVHNGISTYRGHLDDVSARLTAEGDALSLEGVAKVESISIREPEQLRAHVLGEEFFDVANHPEVRFSSDSIELAEDGTAKVVGELEIAGSSRAVTATGAYRAPITDALGGERFALELEATFDRRDFGFDWQMELPSGGNVLDWDVTLTVHLELAKAGEEGE
jgi:polyisoprenoid-binding protein YceI